MPGLLKDCGRRRDTRFTASGGSGRPPIPPEFQLLDSSFGTGLILIAF